MKLKLIGKDIAFPTQNVLLYAQIEDPDKPNTFESFSCSVMVSQDDFFLKKSNLKMMSYYGSESLREGQSSVKDKNYLDLNEKDQTSEGRPWSSTMAKKKNDAGDEIEDVKEDYKTYWEHTSKEFEAQLCSATRPLGKDDVGRIKIKPDKDYNVYVGAKVFYSKVSTDMQAFGDVKEPYVMRLSYKSEDKNEEDTD